jgi:hypothetical protein
MKNTDVRTEKLPLLVDAWLYLHPYGDLGVGANASLNLLLVSAPIFQRILLLTTLIRTSGFGLLDGGMAGMIYVYIGSFVGFFAVVVTMADIASMLVPLHPSTFYTYT